MTATIIPDLHLDSTKVLSAFKTEIRKQKLILSISSLQLCLIHLKKDYPNLSGDCSHIVWYLEATSTAENDCGKDYFLLYKVHTQPQIIINAIDFSDISCAIGINGDLRYDGIYYERQLKDQSNMVYFRQTECH